MKILKVYKLYPDVEIPTFGTEHSACFDIRAYLNVETTKCYDKSNFSCKLPVTDGKCSIAPGDRVLIPSGLILDIPKGYSVRLHARSGMALKQGLVLANSEGVIDCDYVEQLYIMITNISSVTLTINHGDRICQGELIEMIPTRIDVTDARPKTKTDRDGGFGSTGEN